MPARGTRFATRHRLILAVIAVLALFTGLLVSWGRTGSADGPSPTVAARPPLPLGVSTPDPSLTPGSPALGSTPGSTPAPTTGSGAIPGLPGFTLPNSNNLSTLGPGAHRVVLTAKSDKALLVVSYGLRGDKAGTTAYNVRTPLVIARNITGPRPYAAIALQVGPEGTTGSCTITIDGQVVNQRAINKAYAVMECVG